jgi:hypothetical protein
VEYLLLLYADEGASPEHMPDDDREKFYADFRAVNAEIEEKGTHVAARRLDTVETATTQRVVDGKLITTDGPFAETKECLAGFLLVEAEDLDQALDWAGKLPSARVGSVEVRPIKKYS